MNSTVNATPTLESRRALLAERLRKAAGPQSLRPLSFGQQRLWFLQQLEPDSALYNVPILARLSGPLTVSALERSLQALVQRHEVLRTRFRLEDGEPVQIVDATNQFQLRQVDLLAKPADERVPEVHRLAREEVNRTFDLAKEWPIRAVLYRVNPEEHWLALTLHHIASDEWSLAVFFRELQAIYESLLGNRTPELLTLPIQYSDFAAWQRNELRGERLQSQLAYWKQFLSGSPPTLELPADRPRRATPTFRGAQLARDMGLELKSSLQHGAERAQATKFMALLAGFAALLHRYTGQEDILIGCPVAGRNRVETQPLVGFFVNTLPLRISVAANPTFAELLQRVRSLTTDAFAYQDAPFEKIVEELQPERSLTHLPFTRVMFVFQTEPLEEMMLGPVKVQFRDLATDTAKFDLTLVVQDARRGLIARAEYNTDLFEPETIARFLDHFERVLRGGLQQPVQRLSELPLLGESERRLLLEDWNRTEREYPRDCAIHQVFEAVAARSPEARAVTFDPQSLTYGELNARANQLAHYLRECHVGLETPVAVCLERSSRMVVAWLAILKAGGAYVPLDAAYPKERLAFMLRDTGAPVLLTQQSLLERVPRDSIKTIALDSDWELIAGESRRNLPSSAGPEHLAYIIYTSGSTGQPKGVTVPHRAVNRLVLNTNYIDLDARDRVAQVSNASFDAATFEVWGALLNGGELVGIAPDVVLAPALFARELRQRKVTAMFLTAALFNQLAREVPGAFETVRTVMAGGEPLDPKWVRAVLQDRPPARLVNGYGPTENTTFTCCHLIRQLSADATQVPIGRPIGNTQVYVLDQYQNPVPIGVAGELYAGGDGLARGYWNAPELTASKFVANPFDPSGKSRLYRTGDLARFLPDGRIECLGRIDQQVKIRGFRIELGEIETVLARHPGIRQCVVTVRGQSADTRRLIAYFLSSGDVPPNSSDLRAFVAEQLPDYMIPAAFVALDAFPLTANGKVDRKALPAPDQGRPELEREYVAPRDEVEARLTAIWESVLRVHPVGVQDKFFDLGGHSLLAVRLVAQIEKTFGKQLRLATIFQAPTIEQLAPILREEINESSITSVTSVVALRAQGARPPLFLVHGAGGGMFWGYANLCRHLDAEQPVYAFNSRGLDGREELDRIEDLAAEYLNHLRNLQPVGPYFLGGYCFGGNVAYEMARRLAAEGQEVALLALFNCAPPNSQYTRIPWTPKWALRFLRNLVYWANYCRQWSGSQRRAFIHWKWSLLQRKLRGLAPARGGRAPLEAGDMVDLSSYTPEQRRVWEAHLRALVNYHPQPFPGRVHLFRSPGHPLWCSFDPEYGWGSLAQGGVSVTLLPGAHEKVLEEPCVAVLARALTEVLGRSRDSSAATPVAGCANEPERLAYWKRQLQDAPPPLDLPVDFPRQRGQVSHETHSFEIPAPLLEALRQQADRAVADGMAAALLAGFAALLHRYTGRSELIIGTCVALPYDGADGSGPTPLALRCDLAGDPCGRELFHRITATLERGRSVGGLPLARLAEALALPDEQRGSPFFQVGFSFHEAPRTGSNGHAAGLHPDSWTALLELCLHFKYGDGRLTGRLEYQPGLFHPTRIARIADEFCTLLAAALEVPSRPISVLPLLPEEEQKQLAAWNRTQIDYPRDRTLLHLVSEQVARTPDAPALVWAQKRISYRELYRRAEQVAAQLAALGVTPGDLVGVCLERSPDLVASLLGTWLAGAAYVPLDPAYPRERLTFMVADAQLRALITEQKYSKLLPQTNTPLLLLEEINAAAVRPERFPGEERRASDLAYVIYTSGSTGKPKGVALEHRNAVAFIHWARQVFAPEDLDGVLAATSVCFDLSIFELFVPLCCGGKVILAQNALALPSLPAAAEVRLINTVPSAIRELLRLKGIPASVRVINLAGEPLPTELVDELYLKTSVAKVFDLYGPTETTTYSTFALRQPGAPATIGRPLANEQVFVLDKQLQLMPIGVPGELYIGGDGVARGYLNRPELTAQRFVPHPFQPGARLYKTGDLARWRIDGNLEFLGRLDYQVKIRGFRVELGEVESVLKQHSAVRDLLLVAREDVPGDKRLVAYVTMQAGATAGAAELRAHARRTLPEYMVPAAFVFLENLPLTPNGKVDRQALPAPRAEVASAAPGNEKQGATMEGKMTALWEAVLEAKPIGLRDNFFDLGGHSLLASRLVSRIRETFALELPLEALFEAPTISELCERIKNAPSESGVCWPPQKRASRTGATLAFVQERLWFLEQLNPGSPAYHVPMALRLEGPLNSGALEQAIGRMLERHEALRTVFRQQAGALIQVALPSVEIPLARRDFSGRPLAEAEAAAQQWLKAEAQAPFDLERGPLLRVALARLSDTHHLFLVVMHHIVSDGWSLAVWFEELQTYYDAFVAGQPAPKLPSLPISYFDFAEWQRETMTAGRLEQELQYWRDKLAGAPPRTNLPLDHTEPAQPTRRALRCNAPLKPEVARALFDPAHHEHCTPFMLLLAGLMTTLQKWTNQNDLVVGTVMAGRNRSELESLIGCFMNFVPLRTNLAGAQTRSELLERVRATVLEGQAHQDCPFEKIVEALNPDRRLNQNPLYNVALLLQNFPPNLFQPPDLQVTQASMALDAALLDLRFEIERDPERAPRAGAAEPDGDGAYLVTCEYRAELFEETTIRELLTSYLNVLERLLLEPNAKLAELQVTAGLEQQANAAKSHEPSATLAVTATFTAEPIADALRYWFAELELTATVEFAPYNQVFQQLLDPASLLSRNGPGLNVILLRLEDWKPASSAEAAPSSGLPEALQRNVSEFVQAVKAAAARTATPYLVCICPPSPALAGEAESAKALEGAVCRLAAELEPVSGVYLLTSEQLLRWYPVKEYYNPTGDELGHVPYTAPFFAALATGIARKFHALQRPGYKVIVLDCDQTLWGGVCGEDGASGVRLDPAYMALQQFMRAQHDAGRLLCLCSKNNEEDALEVFARRLEMPLRREHFAAWRLNWAPKSENLKALAAELNLGLDSFIFIDDNPVECAEVEANCPEVLTLPLPSAADQIPQFLERCWAFDHLKVTAEDRRRTELYRQNLGRERLRQGSSGLAEFLAGLELQIRITPVSEPHLARVAQLTQRTNQFNFTSRRFTEAEIQLLPLRNDVFTVQVSDRFGDYGLVGVMSGQLAGERFEVELFLLSCRVLGRGVEHQMLAFLGKNARRRGAQWLDIHFVRSEKNRPALEFLEATGADFKQPLNGGYVYRFPADLAAEIVFRPADTNGATVSQPAANGAHSLRAVRGKRAAYAAIAQATTDIAALHERIEAATVLHRGSVRTNYVAPTTPLEKQLCDLWATLLKLERVGRQDNFFEIGGHSLLAVRLFAEIEKMVGRRFPLVTLFQAPTVAQLAAALTERSENLQHPLLVPIQPRGEKPPLFLIHGAGGDVLWGYANLAACMPPDQPIYGIKSRGQAGFEEATSLAGMATDYLEAVRALQPQGPYYLGGYCFGGNVAYEMARQLRRQGQEVALVALLDSAPSNAGYETVTWWHPAFVWRFGRNFRLWLLDFLALRPQERRSFIGRKCRSLARKLKRRFGPQPNGPVDLEEVIDTTQFPAHELKLWQTHLQALVEHVDQPYDGQVLLLRTRGQPLFCSLTEDFCWAKLVHGGVVLRHIPGSHENIFVEPHVKCLAGALAEALDRAQAGSTPNEPSLLQP